MANTKLSFLGTERSQSENHGLLCYANIHNEIYITIEIDGDLPNFICLDKNTAIKLSKELRKQISLLED